MSAEKKQSGLNKDISSIFAGLEEIGNGRSDEAAGRSEKPPAPRDSGAEAANGGGSKTLSLEEGGSQSESARAPSASAGGEPYSGETAGEIFVVGTFPNRRNALIGVDIGRSSLKAVQVYPVAGGWEIGGVAIKEVRLDPDQEGLDRIEAVVAVLKELVSLTHVRSREFACCLRGDGINTILIPLARMPRKELEGASRLEAKRRVSFDVEKALLQSRSVGDQTGRPGAKVNYLVTVLRREVLRRRLEIFQETGLVLKALVPMPFVWKQLLGTLGAGERTVMVVDIGSARSQVHVCKDRQVRFSREFPWGGDQVTSGIVEAGKAFGEKQYIEWEEAEALKRGNNLVTGLGGGQLRSSLTVAQAGSMVRPVIERIVQECRRSLDYYDQLFRDGKVERVYLTGGGALLPGFSSFFQERFSVPVELLLPPETVRFHPSIQDREDVIRKFPILARSAALAMTSKPEVNFVPPLALFLQNLLRSKAAVVILAGFLFLLSFLFYRSKAAVIPRLQSQIADQEALATSLRGGLAPYQELDQLRARLRERGHLHEYSHQRRPAWRGILKELGGLTPPEITLTRITLLASAGVQPHEMEIAGQVLRSRPAAARSPVTDFVVAMENSPYFRNLSKIREDNRAGTFSFNAELVY
ncbi:MAG TPA: pilus assembly protein PilM [bacterium]|nr:pilus assembly protein PilM [bacterium]HPQ66758.1 pilus assembly protein PilM [bacterium]